MDKRDHLVLLTSRPTETEAAILVAALQESGLHAVATGSFTAGFVAEAPGWVRVLVAEDDLPRAKEILAEHEASADEEIDWSQVDVGEPEDE